MPSPVYASGPTPSGSFDGSAGAVPSHVPSRLPPGRGLMVVYPHRPTFVIGGTIRHNHQGPWRWLRAVAGPSKAFSRFCYELRETCDLSLGRSHWPIFAVASTDILLAALQHDQRELLVGTVNATVAAVT